MSPVDSKGKNKKLKLLNAAITIAELFPASVWR
jgi:hypothetical protein